MTATPRRLRFGTKFWFGFGQMAEGMKNAAFNVFLLLFYSQVLGLPAYLGGLALAVALVVDAVTDPMMGSISDASHHRWGRRHPFMYASAVPLWVAFALAFRPPEGLGDLGLFAWMLGFTVLARVAMTLYYVPHMALGAELSSDYHERTVVVAYRNVFGILGAAILILASREVFLVPTPAYPNGQLDPAAYPSMAMTFGIVMMVSVLASALGTHDTIPTLPRPPAHPEPFTVRRLTGEMRDALANRSFRALFSGLLVFFVARGVEQTLSLYMGTFFWRLDTGDVLLLPVMGLLGVVAGTPLWAMAARAMDKRRVFMVGVVWYSLLTTLLPVLQVAGLYPALGSSLYLPILYGVTLLGALGAAGALVAAGSMMADIADEHELDVGRRQEGVFFGALAFSGKAAVGMGSAIAGVALSAIHFPVQVAPDEVAAATILQLGLVAGPGVGALMAAGIVLMSRYDLTRERLEHVQAALAARRVSTAAAT